ncbi:MAG: hypothetical protein ACI9XZ_001917 [Alphaproteobacteria bacterium]
MDFVAFSLEVLVMKCRALAGLFVAALLAGSPAVADQIAGQWCPPGGGRTLVVKGHQDVTFAGKPVQANVDRHHVDFAIPVGEPDAGTKFNADQMNEEQVRVTIGSKTPEIWTPCKPVS